ncbi:uncharacterized protein [Watersipora subatra]|uniref:uncharacterized protein n=1 Tax=Watersipora subatra TaxID=2589382 RepID=UPI00355C78AC
MEEMRRPPVCHRHKQDVIEEDPELVTPSPQPPAENEANERDIADLPWHHAQLVSLYGWQAAEDIIHPKMEKKQLIETDRQAERHASAAQLWAMLRAQSNGKLLEEDRKIPNSLKESYGAFVRQLVLNEGEVPVKRNFYEKEDVDDMDHLVDRRKLLRTLDIRHKTELMGRSSKINQDKTNILLFNNPLPDLVNASGEEGIDRYLPSWLESDDSSEASYRKWLGEDREVSLPNESDNLIELVRPIARDTSRHNGPPRVVFLTEKEAGAERGRFSDKYKSKEAEHSTDRPKGSPPVLASAPIELKAFKGDAVRAKTSQTKAQKQDPTWQPLTLNALVAYSDKRDTRGVGQFRNGRAEVYKTFNSLATPECS